MSLVRSLVVTVGDVRGIPLRGKNLSSPVPDDDDDDVGVWIGV